MKRITLVAILFGLTSCGGGSGGGNSSLDNTDQVLVTSNQSVEVYQDSLVRLNYPSDWTLNTFVADVSAVFTDPEQNEFGGNPTCSLVSEFGPETSLVEIADVNLELIFVESPEPAISFPTINGTAVVRIDGLANVLNQQIEITTQSAYEDGVFHQITCADVSFEETNLILNSMEIL